MRVKSNEICGSSFGVLRLSVERLRHIRLEQALSGGHFAEVAHKLGYTETSAAEGELRWLEAQLVESAQLRKQREAPLVQRLRRARDRFSLRRD